MCVKFDLTGFLILFKENFHKRERVSTFSRGRVRKFRDPLGFYPQHYSTVQTFKISFGGYDISTKIVDTYISSNDKVQYLNFNF